MKKLALRTCSRFTAPLSFVLERCSRSSFTVCKLGNSSCITLSTAIHGLVRFLRAVRKQLTVDSNNLEQALRLLFAINILALAACSSHAPILKKNEFTYKILVATGYSQLAYQSQLSQTQNRYAAEQSAKLNAYRELAKQLYSEELITGITVAEQVISNESFRVYADLFLREAKVKDSPYLSNQKQTILELSVSPRFYYCFSSTVAIVNQCLQQDNKIAFTRVGYQQVPLNTVNLNCAYSGCASQLHVSGFSKKKNSIDSAMLDYGLYDSEWTINMAFKTVLRYFVATEALF